MDDDYDSEFDYSAGSNGCMDLRALLNARCAQREHQVEHQPLVRTTPEEERLT